MRFSLRAYRLLLKLYPASFRERLSRRRCEQQFRAELVDVSGPRALARFWARDALGLRAVHAGATRARGRPGQPSRASPLAAAAHAYAFTVAVLAIAIGANTGVFSVLNAVLLRSLPFTEPDRLAALQKFGPPRDGFHDWRRQSAYLEDATTYDGFEVNLEGVHQAARAGGSRKRPGTSSRFLAGAGRMGGLRAGRGYAGPKSVAVLGHSTWQELYGGDPRAIGSTIRVNGTPLTVVGIAPAGFDYPESRISGLRPPSTSSAFPRPARSSCGRRSDV